MVWVNMQVTEKPYYSGHSSARKRMCMAQGDIVSLNDCGENYGRLTMAEEQSYYIEIGAISGPDQYMAQDFLDEMTEHMVTRHGEEARAAVLELFTDVEDENGEDRRRWAVDVTQFLGFLPQQVRQSLMSNTWFRHTTGNPYQFWVSALGKSVIRRRNAPPL